MGHAIKYISIIIPKDKDIIVFGAFMGRGYGDNSAYLFDHCNTNKKGVYKSVISTLNSVHKRLNK